MQSYKLQQIAIEVIRTLKSRFDSFPDDTTINRNAPFHEAFLNAFSSKLEGKVQSIPTFISLSSWMHGLNTTLGQSFFENVSHILCNGEKKNFKKLLISQQQQNTIAKIITDLKNNNRKPNLKEENSLIFQGNVPQDNEISNFTVDCYFDDCKRIVCVELKTVKPNSGVFKVEKQKMLEAKTALKNANPDKEVLYFLAFPFDPLSSTSIGYDKSAYMKYSVDFEKFIDEEEVLLAGELWDFLADSENTMQTILDIINAIATPDFLTNFEFINNPKNLQSDKERYKQILSEWYLFEELEIADKVVALFQNLPENKDLRKFLNQDIFKNGIDYNYSRLNAIKVYLLN